MMTKRKAVSRLVVASGAIVVAIVLAFGFYLAMYSSGGSGNSATHTSASSNITITQTSTSSKFSLSAPVVLSAGGSTFVNPVMQAWASAFKNVTNGLISVNYQSIGSGGGIQGILQGTFDFAGSDAPVSQSVLASYPGRTLLQIPETLGAISVFYNIPELGNTSLRLTGPVLAQIFKQQITKWNDPSIAALNPGITLPDKQIIVVHRSDGSGSTYAFTTYLSKVDPSWKAQVGVGTSVNWPAGELGGKGSEGVAGTVRQNPYSIGYADFFYAAENHLVVATIQNAAGNWIYPSLASIASAASDFASQLSTNATISIINAPGQNSYPISTFTYLLVWKDQTNTAKAYAIAQFFWWVIHQGQSYGPPLYYPTLPQNVVKVDEALISQINVNGMTFVP